MQLDCSFASGTILDLVILYPTHGSLVVGLQEQYSNKISSSMKALILRITCELQRKFNFEEQILTYVHIPKESRTKLDVKSRKCIFLGYGGNEFGYRLWDPVVRKTIRSQDVVFREDVMFKEGTEEEQKKDKLVVDVQVDGSSQDIHEVHPPLYDSDVGHDNNVDHEESTQSSESRHDSHESENNMSTPPAHDLRRSIRLHKPTQRKHSGLIKT
uniref:Retroviral polymerase SH3-like domain-containing protein n=1 Tax=Ananas comosus var. bracteatus TaxID=296719 RepID=A0A6V7QMF7_ANACO|nr:unnamed protein product [Ananas comosus var. bracteatus]